MTIPNNVAAQLFRLGREATVKVRSESGKNAFGNTTDSYTTDRTVIAFRTYPNRNTEVETNAGDRMRDRPVFLVPTGPDQPSPPDPEDRLEYDGTDYEVKSLTEYDTHVEFFGEKVIHSG